MAYQPTPTNQPVLDTDNDFGLVAGQTALRDKLVTQRYTTLADSVADGLASWWTSTTASGGTAAVTTGEGLLQTTTNTAGSAQLSSVVPAYLPGQVSWFNSAIRLSAAIASNIRRIGVFTVSGTTPQDGFYYELNGTTLNAVTVRGGTATAVAVGSWSKFSTAPFTLDTNYHQLEIRFTSNAAHFFVDNVLRHVASGGGSPITNSLNLPMTLQNINSGSSTNNVLAVRNIGVGRFGQPELIPLLPNATVVSRSGTITTGGTAQVLAAANIWRAGLTIQNTHASADLWLTEDGVTTAALNVGYKLAPGAMAQINTQKSISIWGATTGQTFAATEF